jgi:hypothetical protein
LFAEGIGFLFMDKPNLSLTITISIFLFLSLCIFVGPLQAESGFQKGICYATWQRDRYLSVYSDKSLQALAETGAEYVSVVVTYYQDKFNSQEIFPTQKTPSDESVIHVINKAHQLGLKVMLKPHIDLIDESDGLWRADIGFQSLADWRAWFAQYLRFILHYAVLAEQTHTELLCIGTELCFASMQAEFWKGYIIPNIRRVYSGELIYAANWDEYRNIRFWDRLDYVGINAYFPLAKNSNSEYEEIRASWDEWADEIQAWQDEISKPIIFTEIGYRSCGTAAIRPWESISGKGVNLGLQADCYRAALSILYYRSWCRGLYWWYWETSPYAGGKTNRDFTPQHKPAESVLSSWYKKPCIARLSRP